MYIVNIWYGIEQVPDDLGKTVVTIGNFDGVHRGHMALLNAAVQRCDDDTQGVLLTFDPHPLAVVRPDKVPLLLTSVEQRAEQAQKAGIDNVLALKFDKERADQSPEDFFNEVLVDTLNAETIVVGENFTFGKRAAGTTETLQQLGREDGIDIIVVPIQGDQDQDFSSTYIREQLAQGNILRVDEALGRPYEVRGPVTRGAGRGGKELGYPTANLYFPDSVALPADGVYAGTLEIMEDSVEGTMPTHTPLPAAISVGTNPTFGDEERSVEAFVLDHDSDLYDKDVKVAFFAHLRDMEKFDGVDDLLVAMKKDVSRTREIFDAVN